MSPSSSDGQGEAKDLEIMSSSRASLLKEIAVATTRIAKVAKDVVNGKKETEGEREGKREKEGEGEEQ